MTEEIRIEPVDEDKDFEIAALRWSVERDMAILIYLIGLGETIKFINKMRSDILVKSK